MSVTKLTTNSFTGLEKYDSFLAGNGPVLGGSYQSIATANGTGSSGTITFSSIPNTFSHLQLRMISKGSAAYYGLAGMEVRFNSDSTAANYYNHNLRGDGSTAVASPGASNSSYVWSSGGASGTTTYVAGILDIFNYGDGVTYTTSRSLLGVDYNGSGIVVLGSLLWKNTAVISSITLVSDSTYVGNWTTATQFALYGVL